MLIIRRKIRLGVLLCINGVGILNSWIKRNIAPAGMDYDGLNELAAGIPVGSEGLSILPFETELNGCCRTSLLLVRFTV